MSTLKLGKFLIVASVVVGMAGCSWFKSKEDADTGASSGAASGDVSGQALTDAERLRQIDTYYFDFDQSTLKQEAYDSLNAHAQYLASNPNTRVLIEGHCDERGTNEYNMALGERRAKAVAEYLGLQGVSSAQIETVSYGEEKPVATCSDESCWWQNRRSKVNYQ